jgi:hypothetical protein
VLSWPAAFGAATYDVYLNAGTGTPTTIVSANQTATTYTATTTAGPYVWKVVPKNSFGTATGCPVWSFNTVTPTVAEVTITASPGANVCVGTRATFTATPVNGGASPTYQWRRNGFNVGTNSPTYFPATTNAGDQVSVIMTSNAACPAPVSDTSNVITITTVPRPTASITVTDTSFCAGGSTLLSANTGTGLSYQWLLNGAAITGATAATHRAVANGVYRVAVFNGTCTDTAASRNINVRPSPSVITTLSGAPAFCANSSLTIDAVADSTYTYQWLANGNALPGQNGPSLFTDTAGNYTVVITANGCKDTSDVVATTVLPLPQATATAGGALSFCIPGSVQLSANTGTGLTYQWLQNGTEILPAVTTANYTATTSGAYRVVVSNGTCQDTSNTLTVTASMLPAPAVTVAGPTTFFCQGSNVQLRTPQVPGYTYQWYRSGTPIAPGGTTFIYNATTSGAYHVVITNGACVATSTPVNVTVNPLPAATATAAGPVAFCQGGSVVLSANTGTGLTYQWRRNGAPLPGETNTTFTATQSGSYQVAVFNGTCTRLSNAVNVVVSTMPVATITPQGALTFCQNGNVVLGATPGPGYTYQWINNGTDIPGATAAIYAATVSGSYTVRITNGTCTDASPALSVSVTPSPQALINASGPLTFCQGGSVTLSGTRGAGYTYQWLRNGVPLAGKTTSTLAVSTSGSYQVLISDGTCDSTAPAAVVNVRAIPMIVVTVGTGNTLRAPAGYQTYQWYRNGVAISGATDSGYVATHDGYYAVVVSDDAGCSATSSVKRITSLEIGSTPITGTVSIYPNPASDKVIVDAGGITVDAQLTTIDGRVIAAQQRVRTMSLTGIADGIYLIHITEHGTGRLIKTEKLMKGNR